MDGRNDKANNRYGLRNREHRNSNDVLSINKQWSKDKEEDKEEEDEVDHPHQRLRFDKANNKDPGEMLDVPRVIDFEGDLDQILIPEGREGGHKDNNDQRGALCDTQGQGGGGCGRIANNQGQGGGGCGGGGLGGGGLEGAAQGPAAAAINQGRGGGEGGGGGHDGAPQINAE